MGDRDRKEKGEDSLGGELDSKTRAGADAITSAKNEADKHAIEKNKGKADPKIGKVQPKSSGDNRE